MLIKVFCYLYQQAENIAAAAGTQAEQNFYSWIQGYLFVSWSD